MDPERVELCRNSSSLSLESDSSSLEGDNQHIQLSSSSHPDLSFKAIISMTLLAVQFSIQPVLTKRFISNDAVKSSIILVMNVIKLLISSAGIHFGSTSWVAITNGWTLASWLQLVLLPATIYLVLQMVHCCKNTYQ